MHRPVRRVLTFLGVGSFALMGGFTLLLATVTGLVKLSVEAMIAGGVLMLVGVGLFLFGLVLFAMRKPTAAEIAGGTADEPRSWHFTRFGVGYLLVMLFGYPALMMLAPEPRWPFFVLVGLGYTVFGLGFLVPALRRVFFYAPQDLPAPAPDVQPHSVVEYYGPLVAVAALGLAALGGVLALTAEDAQTQRRALGGVVMGSVLFVVSVVPAWRRRFLRPRDWNK